MLQKWVQPIAFFKHILGIYGANFIFALEVREHNAAAQKLYISNGFTPVGIKLKQDGTPEKYYHHPEENALNMIRKPVNSIQP